MPRRARRWRWRGRWSAPRVMFLGFPCSRGTQPSCHFGRLAGRRSGAILRVIPRTKESCRVSPDVPGIHIRVNPVMAPLIGTPSAMLVKVGICVVVLALTTRIMSPRMATGLRMAVAVYMIVATATVGQDADLVS